MQLQWWSVLPFATMLASIAVLPLVPATAHWWARRSSQMTVSLLLGVPVAAWVWAALGWQEVLASVVEYTQFICLLLALFVVSGGIFLKGDIRATPRRNPRNSGGSPSGVSRPPQLATTRMVKMTVWTR